MSRTLGSQFGVSTRCIEKIWKKFREVWSVAQALGRGRKRITNDRDDRMIAKQAKKDRFVTATEIQANLALRVSQDTIYRRIKETTGFGSYHACRKPFLREANIIKRREWCLLRANWTVEQWRRVIWSDDSPFVLRCQRTLNVWRLPEEKYRKECQQASIKHDKKVMVWWCFAAHGLDHFHWIEGIINQHVYREIITNHLEPSAQQLFPDETYLFHQDNDPKHKARTVMTYLKEKNIPR
jgi:hypothetical protein